MKDTYTLEYSFCGGWMEPAQWQAVLDAVDGGCRFVSFSTVSIPLDGEEELACVKKGLALAEKLSRLAPWAEQAVDVGSSLSWGENRDAWLEFAGKLNRFSSPVSFPAYEIRKNRERFFSSDPRPEERFSALHKRTRICLEEAPHDEFGLFSCDLGFVVPRGGHPEGGVHLFAGGGGGIQGGSPALAPRAASWLGRYSLPEALKAAGVLAVLNELFGEPGNPRKRRLKSLFAARGLDWVLNELKKAGLYPGEGEKPEFSSSGEWSRNDFYNGLLVALPSGRLEDTPEYAVAAALRSVAPLLTSPVRITPRGNLRFHPADRCAAERLKVLLRGSRHFSPLSIQSCSCRGLPGCRRARSASSLIHQELNGWLEGILQEFGLEEEPVVFRISGCPNGCSRPLFAELALVGRSEGVYDVFAGGSAQGDRTALLLRRAVPIGEVQGLFRELFRQFALDRQENGERVFGEWIFDRILSGGTEPGCSCHP
ncbi:hypothetical protein [uncultured Akkermansia sp.]|uniref:hypothetical protein n=1 Tax=uncultured Akkermansia sp. TaxID=512294 RepID=UPI00265CA04E|nr:hypothetical protein [uncultured Akkermansia sp.]